MIISINYNIVYDCDKKTMEKQFIIISSIFISVKLCHFVRICLYAEKLCSTSTLVIVIGAYLKLYNNSGEKCLIEERSHHGVF